MKKVVLMTGVLAAGLAAAPVTANAAAPSSPKLSETNEVKAQDPVDVYNRYAALIVARRAEVDGNRQSIINNLAPFTKDEMKFTDKVATETYDWENKKWESGEYVYGLDYQGFPLEFAGEEYNPANGDWHPKAKAEALDILSDFEHELHNMELALNELWNKYDVLGEITEDEFYEKLKAPYTASGADFAVTIAKIMSPDYSQNILPERLKKLNKDWNIFTEYQLLGEEKWAQYFYLTQQQEYKEVNETYDVINTYKVQTKSNDFRTFLEEKHANRKNHIGEDNRTFCDGDCCEDSKNLDEIKERYAAFCAEHKAELNLVLKYQADRKSLLDGEKGLSAVYETYRADFDPTTIQSTADPQNPGADSDEATFQIKAQKTKIENAKKATEDFIRTFNAAGKTFAQWNEVVPKWDGEGKDFTRGSETKHLDNGNYNAEAKQQIADLEQLIADYEALIAAAEKNRDNYDKLYKDILDTDDWNAQDKSHDADALDKHDKVKYYESHAFDTEVPAARQAALDKATEKYEAFELKTDAELATAKTNNTSALDTKYEIYKDMVDRANKNEGAHDTQHKTLDGYRQTYRDLVKEFGELTDLVGVNDNPEHKNIEGKDVKELYPVNETHSTEPEMADLKYTGGSKKAIADLVDAKVNHLDPAESAAIAKTEEFYHAGTSYVAANNNALMGTDGLYDKLNKENDNFRKALDAARDNEVAFLEGAHLLDELNKKAHHDLDEYAHHPETFGHWNDEIKAVIDMFPAVAKALVKAYDVDAKARDYVKDVLPAQLAAITNEINNLEQLIKDNQTARDANEAAINAALTDLADLKKKYDETHFTTEEDKTGEATALKADFQQAWKDYVANDLQVPALFEAPATESDLHFAQTAVGVDFDADIQAMLSAIKSENSIDFDIHHQATNDYALNLAATKYIKDVVIPALDKKFDELVKANEDAHKAQYDAYAQFKKDYDCTEIAATAIAAIADPAYEHSKADATVKTALDNYKKQIDDSYIAGSAKADDATIAGLKTTYENSLDAAQKNDKKFVDAYNDFVSAKANVKYTYENWKADYFANGANKYSDEANVQVTKAYNEMVEAANAYLKDIKTDWYNEEAIAKAGNNTALLNAYKSAVTAYNTAVENAQKNDAELTKELNALGAKIELVAYNGKIDRTTANAEFKELYKHIDELAAAANSYNDVKSDIVADWEHEYLIKSAVVTANNNAINNYITSANKYNALMVRINVCAQDQFDLNEAIAEVNALPVVTTKLNDKHEYNEYDKDRQGLLNEETRIQNLIKTLEKEIDKAYEGGSAYNCTAEDAAIDKAVKDLVAKAKAENDKFLANEAAFEPLHTNLHNLINYAEDTASLKDPAKEAFEKAVAGYVAELRDLVKKLEEAYREEKANTVDADVKARYEELLGLITDSKKLAEEVGKDLGDVNKDGEVDEWDSTGSNPDGIVEIVLYDRAYNKYGDMDLNGANDITDINLLNNLLWHQSVYGKKAGAADVEFEGSVDLVVAGNTVALALNNTVAVNGIQFDVTVPAGAKLSSVIGTARAEGLNVLSAKIAEDTYRVLVVSLGASKVINGNDGNLVSFNVSGEGEVEVYNVIATDGVSHKLNGAAVSLGQTTGIDEIASEGNTEIFGLDGIRQNVMKAGVNIVRGANGVVKKIFK